MISNSLIKMLCGQDFLRFALKEELHQLLIGLFGEHILPAIKFEYQRVLHHVDLVKKLREDGGVGEHACMDKMLRGVWLRLRDHLSSVELSLSMLQLTPEYAEHFYALYVDQHQGTKFTGDLIKMLLLTVPFFLCSLITPEAVSSCLQSRHCCVKMYTAV